MTRIIAIRPIVDGIDLGQGEEPVAVNLAVGEEADVSDAFARLLVETAKQAEIVEG